MSAPSSSGCCPSGVANVLSTTAIAPRLRGRERMAGRSATCSSGFEGDSSQRRSACSAACSQPSVGHLTPDNVRLAHRLWNQRDYTWRKKINALLAKRMSLDEIAEKPNVEKVPTIHGTNRWTAASVRKAFVS
jgi:hypothetical protein